MRLLSPAVTIWEHRCLVITIHTAKFGPLQIANLYQDVYASDEDKFCHLARLWDRLRSKPGRPILGGDFNMTPQQVRRWTQSIAAAVLAPSHETYATAVSETTTDFYVADHVLCMGQANAEAVLEEPCAPHRPV